MSSMELKQIANCNGKFIFSPDRPGLKKTHRSFDNGIILKVDNGITDYYSWWLWKRHGITLSRPAWGTHVTVVNDRDRVKDLKAFDELKKSFNGKIIRLGHQVNLKKQWQFWVLDVAPAPELVKIRRELGLKENYPFHITIGRDDCG